MDIGIHSLEPHTDIHEFSTVNGITIITAESDLADLSNHISADLILEEL
jgi:hypothetical protein